MSFPSSTSTQAEGVGGASGQERGLADRRYGAPAPKDRHPLGSRGARCGRHGVGCLGDGRSRSAALVGPSGPHQLALLASAGAPTSPSETYRLDPSTTRMAAARATGEAGAGLRPARSPLGDMSPYRRVEPSTRSGASEPSAPARRAGSANEPVNVTPAGELARRSVTAPAQGLNLRRLHGSRCRTCSMATGVESVGANATIGPPPPRVGHRVWSFEFTSVNSGPFLVLQPVKMG